MMAPRLVGFEEYTLGEVEKVNEQTSNFCQLIHYHIEQIETKHPEAQQKLQVNLLTKAEIDSLVIELEALDQYVRARIEALWDTKNQHQVKGSIFQAEYKKKERLDELYSSFLLANNTKAQLTEVFTKNYPSAALAALYRIKQEAMIMNHAFTEFIAI